MKKIIVFALLAACSLSLVTGCRKKEPEKAPTGVTVVVPPPISSPLVERGAKVFQEKCSVCHKINGIGGSIGTDLSKVGERHDAVFLQTQLQNPALYKKDTRMPSFKDMPQGDMDALIAYLLTLK